MKIFLYLFILLIFIGCNDTPKKQYNGKKLLEQKCSSCHDLNLPPNWEKSKLAPPIMAVTFHVYDLVDKDITTKISSSKEFIINYVLNPDKSKSLCDKDSLKQYGLMPSQKGNVTKEELNAISKYMLEFYTQKHLYKIQKAQEYLKSLKPGNRLALKYKCLSCHKINKKLVGPSFKEISQKKDLNTIKNSIKNGSKGRWKNIKASMPAFNNIPNNELETISKWIKDVK